MKEQRKYPIELKRVAIVRLNAGERVSAVARDLKVPNYRLYYWRARYRAGGAEALCDSGGRPRQRTMAARSWEAADDELGAAKRHIGELERKIGQQQVDLDFFRRALRHVKARQQTSAAPSTRSSKR